MPSKEELLAKLDEVQDENNGIALNLDEIMAQAGIGDARMFDQNTRISELWSMINALPDDQPPEPPPPSTYTPLDGEQLSGTKLITSGTYQDVTIGMDADIEGDGQYRTDTVFKGMGRNFAPDPQRLAKMVVSGYGLPSGSAVGNMATSIDIFNVAILKAPNSNLAVGPGSIVRQISVLDGGRYGWKGGGSDVVLEDLTADGNNTQHPEDVNFDAGAVKIVGGLNWNITRYYAQRNNGSGLWADGDNDLFYVESPNIKENVNGHAIHWELSWRLQVYGGFLWADKAAIYQSTSQDVEVERVNMRGPVLVHDNKARKALPYVHTSVINSDITLVPGSGWRMGVRSQDEGSGVAPRAGLYTPHNFVYRGNTYRGFGPYDTVFRWGGKNLTFAQWQGLGFDLDSKVV